MTDTFSCDYCRGTIDISTDNALIVGVHRRVDADEWDNKPDALMTGEQLAFRYCSQLHLGAHMERTPLPSVTIDDSGEVAAMFGCLALVLLGAAGVALMVYGAIQFWHEVIHR